MNYLISLIRQPDKHWINILAIVSSSVFLVLKNGRYFSRLCDSLTLNVGTAMPILVKMNIIFNLNKPKIILKLNFD